MYEPHMEAAAKNFNDSSKVVFGHKIVQTRDVNWLCLDEIYQKFYRPNMYDIGGTHTQDIPDYWFTFKTEQVGRLFLLHLFICNHDVDSFKVTLSTCNQIRIDKKKNTAYMDQLLKEFRCDDLPKLSHKYLTTYNFTDLDVNSLLNKKLYIAVSFPFTNNNCISIETINNIKLKYDCGALLTDPIGSDFIIESVDGRKFHVHKVILAAHSDVFRAMLKEDTAESQNNFVKLVDVNQEELCLLLEYIYTGTIVDVENVSFIPMLMLADKYNIQGLYELSQYVLSQQISMDNVLNTLVLADIYESDFLKLEAMKFIKRNPEVLYSSSFKDVKSPSLVRELCMYLAS